MNDRQIMVGQVSGLFGVQGWVKIYSFTQPIENIFSYGPWWLRSVREGKEETEKFVVANSRRQGRGLVAQLAGIDDRNAAADLVGAEIFVDRDQFANTATDEYYWADLVGLTVETEEGGLLGCVDSVLATGANDVLIVEGERRHLVPFVTGQVIKEVDTEAGKIVVV